MGEFGVFEFELARQFTFRFDVLASRLLSTQVRIPAMRHELIGQASAPATVRLADPFHSSSSARVCRELIDARARRSLFFKASLFADPAWDILLELFAADCDGRKLSISSVGLEAKIAMTTALRWI